MKHFYTFLALFIGNLAVAQDSRLFENAWYLTTLTVDGTDVPPPFNSEVSNITLTFNQENALLETSVCNFLSATVTFEDNITNFSLSDLMATLGWCEIPTNEPYDNLYLGFYLGSDETHDFTYTITESENVRTLTISDMFNRQAIYSNTMLSRTEPETAEVSIYPNPASDYISIRLNNPENALTEIYDGLGKLCKTGKIESGQGSIAVEDLSGGIYFIKIKTDSGTFTKKWVKL